MLHAYKELRLDIAGSVSPPVDMGIQDIHALLIEIPGDATKVRLAVRIPDGSINRAQDVYASNSKGNKE